MTSSNAAATDEGPAARNGSPPPSILATSGTIKTSISSDSADAPGVASAASKPLDKPNLSIDTDVPATSIPAQPSRETHTDIPIPSPPTVSPLSTPAATHINIDDSFPDEALSKLTTDQPPLPLTRDPSIFRSGIFEASHSTNGMSSTTAGVGLGEPFMPHQSSYYRRPQVEAIATTDPDPNSADYSSHGILSGMRLSQGSIDPNAYIMNLTTQPPRFQDTAPLGIDPSAVSLHSFTQDSDVHLEPSSASGSQKLESFAKIEFADSTFQMTTYTVIIGRDQQAMNQARADEKREASYRRKCEENERIGLPPPTPIMHDRGKFSKSYVSEEGGMLGPEHSDGEQDNRPAKRRRLSSAVQSLAGDDNASGDHVQSNRQYVSHTPGAAAVDLDALQTSPEHIPFIGIHSPGPDIASKTRGISRQHLKIQFNKARGVFEGIALHKNGFFCEDVLYGLDKPATLKSGDRLQIKDVEFFFVINGVQIGMTGGEDEDVASTKRMSVGGKEISLDFEHSDHENFRDTSEELSDVENIPTPTIEPQPDLEAEPEAEEQAQAQAQVQAQPETQPQAQEEERQSTDRQMSVGEENPFADLTRAELEMLQDLPPDFPLPEGIPRRRGPGRPPKDGIMSKRERRLLKKQLQETCKKTLPQESQEEKIKRPVGRPRKNPVAEDGEREKRKYNKRKREDGEEGSDTEKRTKEKKDKKVRPKSPPLDLRIEDYTTEQLQKPTKNYGVLIDEALTNGPPDGLTLKQIYKRITARYPWFYFSAETKGWESSKDEETGLWSRVPGVELDAGKKRKASSPDRLLGNAHLHTHMAHSSYFQNNPYTNAGTAAYGRGLPNYSTEQSQAQAGFTPAAQNAPLHATTAQPVSQSVYPAQTPAPAQLPPGYGSLAIPRPTSTPQQSTYSSPYARPPPPPPPPPPTNPSAGTNTDVANGQATATAAGGSTAQHLQPGSNATNTGAREQLTPDIERAIMQFSANMLNVITKSTPHAANIIECAVNRVRGIPVRNRVPGFDSVENTLISAMQGMIADMKRKNRYTTSASPAPAAASAPTTPTPRATGTPAPNSVEAEIQRRLRNFRESMADIIVDSAINRAQGLPHAGKIPGWEEADKLMVNAHSKLQQASPAPPVASRPPAAQPVQPVARAEPSPSPAISQASATSFPQATPPNNSAPSASHAPAAQVPSSTGGPSLQPPPIHRPVAFSRPPITSSMARPPTVSASPRPNVSSPAPPSADDSLARQNGVNAGVNAGAGASSGYRAPAGNAANGVNTSTTTNLTSGANSQSSGNPNVVNNNDGAATSTTVVRKESEGSIQSSTAEKPARSEPAAKVVAPMHNMSGPAPPSAGVVDQIAGHKRSLDEGPGSASTEQREPKRVGVSSN
ncbi:hypothetical protein GGS20DRAFT_577029 [Poronia punctata]|nr:hypothetical protein GGS20DRAFT_577029 [Poronia punctata]